MSSSEMAGLMAIGSGILLFGLILMIVPYLFGAIALYTMAKRESIDNEWLAFIPIGNTYIIGELIDEKLGWLNWNTSGGLKLLIIYGASFIISFVPILGNIIGLVLGIFGLVTLYWLYEKYSNQAVLLTIITVITGGLAAFIILFMIRNKQRLY